MPESIIFRQADLTLESDLQSVVQMVDDYAADAMGGGERLAPEILNAMPQGLRQAPGAVVFLAEDAGVPFGVAVCFMGYSTFAGKPKLNIHDFSINPSHRRRGLGRRLMQAVIAHADAAGCGKVTLEVRQDNAAAKALYAAEGFGQSDPPYEFWTRNPGD